MLLLGDYSLNVANELTALILRRAGLTRLTPSYDLNFPQIAALLQRSDPSLFELVIHQQMPMFHMEHCVFAATLSQGRDFHDCGRPCETHAVDLRDRTGLSHPLVADAGCRNTVYNGRPQSAANYIPRLQALGVHHFRLELLRDDAQQTHRLLTHYAAILAGHPTDYPAPRSPHSPSVGFPRSLPILNQIGVTPGTFAHE